MVSTLDVRIDAMFRRDCLWAWGFVVALWLAEGFVFLATYPLTDSGGVHLALLLALIALLVLNTAAIAAMVRHYAHDKAFIYSLDIRHLDQYRASASGGAARQPAE